MTDLLTSTPQAPAPQPSREPVPGRRALDLRRLKQPMTYLCLVGSFIGALGTAFGSIVAGRVAESPSGQLVSLLALCIVGGALVDTLARTMWAAVIDRAAGRLRADLLDAALAQPLSELSEQAVGEILDRIDDDSHEVGNLFRWAVWMAVRTTLATGPLWVVASFTWWPASFLFPLTGLAAWLVIRKKLPLIAERKVVEEAAWTDHAAALEEGIAARDDLRTSLGQPYLIRRLAELSADIHRKLDAVLHIEAQITRRTGALLHGLLAGITLTGIALALGGNLSTAELVTLFVVSAGFVGQVDMLARHIPDLQEGLGAIFRLRGMLAVQPEPEGGRPMPTGPIDLEFKNLDFHYGAGTFGLRDINLVVPAGTTCAFVGRTGSGKSTLASLVSRAVEPAAGSTFLGGVDVTDLDVQQLRSCVGVVTQRTEILAGTLRENITLWSPMPRQRVQDAVDELGLTSWVAGLPDGLETLLGPGGATLSAGEEQLVAFARLLVRDVRVVILDEATARMDPLTEVRVVKAADRLLTGRTGILVAHRLSTTERAQQVLVLEGGRIIQHGSRQELASAQGPFRDLLAASAHEQVELEPAEPDAEAGARQIGTQRRSTTPPPPPEVAAPPTLARSTFSALMMEKRWGIFPALLFLISSITGAFGALTGAVWGLIVTQVGQGRVAPWLLVALVVSLMSAPLLLTSAIRRYPHWWITVMLRVRMNILLGQTRQHRLERTPPGEVVSRSMDADRQARYADRWVDFINGILVVIITMALARNVFAGLILVVVMVSSAGASALGRPIAGRSAAASSAARARFGRALVSALESVRTVKLAGATDDVHRHLLEVDGGRVDAQVKENRVRAILEGVPIVMVQCGVVAAWAGLAFGEWSLAIALLVANAVGGFDYFGRVAGMVVTEAPGVRNWMEATSKFAGGGNLMHLPSSIDLHQGHAPAPTPAICDPLRSLEVRDFHAIHDDGTIGVSGVDLVLGPGELVLLLGPVGSGKSSLLAALAGLVGSRGELLWNGSPIQDRQSDLRPGRIAHVAQTPRVLSGTFRGNIALDHPERNITRAIEMSRLERDVADAGGPDALVGHRGVRLSGGQVQRLALARALACEADLLLADDVSSALDAATELELWRALRSGGSTVIGATSKAAALAQADRVVVLHEGTVAEAGPWSDLQQRWRHLAG